MQYPDNSTYITYMSYPVITICTTPIIVYVEPIVISPRFNLPH